MNVLNSQIISNSDSICLTMYLITLCVPFFMKPVEADVAMLWFLLSFFSLLGSRPLVADFFSFSYSLLFCDSFFLFLLTFLCFLAHFLCVVTFFVTSRKSP